MDPMAALRRIGFLLERAQSPTYRVKAFRNAALALAGLPPGDLEQRARSGSLLQIAGIGPKTAAVVEQALNGTTPSYLADLEAAAGALTEGGTELRAQLRGDLHLHSDWSDGGSPIEEMAVSAVEIGHEYSALTDHSPRLAVAHGLTATRLEQQLAIVERLNSRLGNFRLLSGIECDINSDGTLDQTEDLLGRVDIVVASVHSELRAPADVMTARMLTAIANPYTDILGHCTGRLVAPGVRTGRPDKRAESTFDAAAVFRACAERGVAVEINSRPERLDPPKRLMRLAIDAGCLFSVDTDAHAPGQLDWQVYGCARAEECLVPVGQIINTWPVDQLLEWTRRAR